MKLLEKPVCIVIYGPQASGKGTQAENIVRAVNLKLITTGNLLRNEQKKKTALAKKIHLSMQKGELVDDKTIATLLNNELSKNENTNGVLIDCFPRNKAQIIYFKDILKKYNFKKVIAIFLKINQQTAVSRIINRKICTNCQTPYGPMHKDYKKNICSKCKGKLTKRSDDTPEALKKRLEAYYNETLPAIEYFKKNYLLLEIDGEPNIDTVSKTVFEQLIVKGVIKK